MTRLRLRAAVVILAVTALFLLAACSGDDSSSTSPTTRKKDTKLSVADYTALFATNIAGENNAFGATPQEAQCVAKAAVAKIGAARLQAAGLTRSWFAATKKPPTELTSAEATQIVDAFYGCYDVTERFMQAQAGGTITPQQQACVAHDSTVRQFLPVVLREGGDATLTVQQVESLVDTLLKCVPAGEVFRNRVKGTVQLTDAQVACLNSALMSSTDYRDALVQALLGKVDTSKAPAYADEVGRCIKLQ